jgi:dCMP deaminase
MSDKHKIAHMKTAFNYAACSTAEKLKVGCVIIKDNRIISIGYNGMPSGWDNVCEEKEYMDGAAGGWLGVEEIEYMWPLTEEIDGKRYKLKTKKEVLHAESNAIAKLAKSTESGNKASAYITHAPCLECAKLLYQSGIKEVYYCKDFTNTLGIEFLWKCNIFVEKIDDSLLS